jgi:hypothetical protein
MLGEKMNLIQKPAVLLLIFLAVGFPFKLGAEENSIHRLTSYSTQLKPIEIHYTTLAGLTYSINDEVLLNNKDFETLIFPLNDYEAIRLLKRSESSASTGGVLQIIGVGGLLTGITGLLTSSPSQRTPFWITAIGGGISLDIGGLFQTESQTTKFGSVQRYNRFARGEEQALPQTPQDEKSLLNFDQPVKTAIPDKTHSQKENHP